MDVARPAAHRPRPRRALYWIAGFTAIALATVYASRLEPAAPAVQRSSVWIDTVRRGPLVREVRGLGTLVPEDLRWIPAATQGRVERVLLRPGSRVTADAVILELSNPQLDLDVQDARLKLAAAEAALQDLRAQTRTQYLQQKAAAAAVDADYAKAQMTADMNAALAKQNLVSQLVLRQSEVDARQLATRSAIAREQLDADQQAADARIAVQQSAVDQARALLRLREQQRADLHVRAGINGILQLVPVDVGQQVAQGTNLARVASPERLKAEIRIPETQAVDVQVGQVARVDTRSGVVDGRVARVDPSVQNGTRTVDVTFTGPLPKGAVPDLSVDGTIEIERVPDALFVGRPAFAKEHSTVTLFRIGQGGEAERVSVSLGRASIQAVEIVSGLRAGDRVVLSDMSAWDRADRIRIQ